MILVQILGYLFLLPSMMYRIQEEEEEEKVGSIHVLAPVLAPVLVKF